MSEWNFASFTRRFPRLDPSRWPLVLWQEPALFVLAFLLGGVVTFAYSYAPLHRAHLWKIEYLEDRLASRTTQAKELEAELANARSAAEAAPEADTLAAVQARLDEATKLADARKREVAGLEAKLSNVERSLEQERTAREAAEADRDALASRRREPAPPIAGGGPTQAPPTVAPEAPPAAPAAGNDDDAVYGPADDRPDTAG